MKKLIYVFSLLALMACSKDSINEKPVNKSTVEAANPLPTETYE